MKKFFSILIALVLVLQVASFGGAATQKSNAAEAVCYLGNVSAKYGSDTVKVPIYLENNPGIISIQLEIYYPTDYFTLTDIDYNEECGLGVNIGSDVFSQHPFVFIMGKDTATANCTFNGVIAELVLKVKDTAPAAGYDIEIKNATAEGALAMNANLAIVDFTAKNGSICLVEETTPTPVPTATPTAPATGTVTGEPAGTPSGTETGDPGATNVPGNTNVPGSTNVPVTTNAPGTTSAPGNDPSQSDGNTGAVPTGSTTDDTSSGGQPGSTANPSPTNIPVTTATPAPETDGPSATDPSGSTLTPSSGDPGQTLEPSSDKPSGNATATPGSDDEDDKGDGEEDKKGCDSATPAIAVIIVCVVLCAAGITAVWVTNKKNKK
ncbi:MAG: hypothetical protein J6A50_03140 [Clostridia bacterium]|nr:hypothetical protein [Clostridia bacterium]